MEPVSKAVYRTIKFGSLVGFMKANKKIEYGIVFGKSRNPTYVDVFTRTGKRFDVLPDRIVYVSGTDLFESIPA